MDRNGKKMNIGIVKLCALMGYSQVEIEMALHKGYKLLTHTKYLKQNQKYSQLRQAAVCYHLHYNHHYRMKVTQHIETHNHKTDSNEEEEESQLVDTKVFNLNTWTPSPDSNQGETSVEKKRKNNKKSNIDACTQLWKEDVETTTLVNRDSDSSVSSTELVGSSTSSFDCKT